LAGSRGVAGSAPSCWLAINQSLRPYHTGGKRLIEIGGPITRRPDARQPSAGRKEDVPELGMALNVQRIIIGYRV
jgi:hypothetical protein